MPLYPLSIAVDLLHVGEATIYASYNGSTGSTETVAWRLLAGPTPFNLSVVIYSTTRTGFGFETDIDVILLDLIFSSKGTGFIRRSDRDVTDYLREK